VDKVERNEKKSERLRGPGFWETLREAFLGARRPMDCVQVEVSSRCPARCTYCPHTVLASRWRPRDMGMGTFQRLWPLLRLSSRVHLQGWGEPLLNPAFFEMAALACKAGCQVSTTTCGLRMDEGTARRLVDSGLDIVAFSLTGTDAGSNAARKGADFERVVAAVDTLQRVRRARMGVHLEVHFAYLMLASEMEAVAALPALARRLGVHAVVVSTLDYLPEPGLAPEAFGPDEPEKRARAAALLAETAAEARRLEVGFDASLQDPSTPGTGCRENVARALFVSAEGDMSPCVYVNLPVNGPDPRRRVFGNVNAADPVAIWEGEAFARFRQGLAGGDPDSACRGCPKRFMG
jgi:MoaA/NifB/PqqE/SkfB family radical SAM enzyme